MEVPGNLQLVQSILQAVLSPDNAVRKAQEQELSRLSAQHPSDLVICLLTLLRTAAEPNIRALAAVLMRQMMTALNTSAPALWDHLRPEVQATVKRELLSGLMTEPEKTVRKRVADTIGELGATVLSAGDEAGWPELLPFVFGYMQNEEQLTASLQILATLATYIHGRLMAHKAEMWKMFSMGLQAEAINTAVVAVGTICTFLSIIKTSDAMEFSSLLLPLMTCSFRAVKSSDLDGKEVLESLVDLSEAEPQFFAQQFDTMISFLTDVFALDVGIGVKSLVVEMMISLVERKPKLVRKNEERSKVLLEKVFFLMISVDPEVGDTWSRPPEGFQDKDDTEEIEIDYAQTGRKCISRLMESVGDEHLFPYLTTAVQTLLANETDWRMKYSALMTISELGQYIEDEGKIGSLVAAVLPHTALSMHPKIRYAAYHAIGQLCEDLGDDLRNIYHQPLAQVLLAGLADPIPRVVSHCAAAIINFFEDATSDIVVKYYSAFTEKLVPLIQKSQPSLVIEYGLSALASVADAAEEHFRPQYSVLLPVLLDIITVYTDSTYKHLRGRAIECLTLMCISVGKSVYLPHLGQIVSLLKRIQEQELVKADPQTSYILTAWQRLCADLKGDFALCLPEVIPGLLAMAQVYVTASTALAPEATFNLEEISSVSNKSKSLNVNTAELEDKKVALETLLTIMEMMKGSYLPFVQETVSLCLPLVSYSINEDVRVAACGCLGAALRTVKESVLADAVAQTIALARMIFPGVWEALDREFDADATVAQLQTLKAIIEAPDKPFLTQAEIQQIAEGVIKLLDKTLNEKSPADTQDSDSESEDQLTSLRKLEESQLHTAIAEVFTAMFKTHTSESLPVASYFLSTKLPVLLDPTGKDDNVKFAIYIIDDMVEFVGRERLGEVWMQLKDPLLSHCTAPNPEIRQPACYGLGIFAINTPTEVFAQVSAQIVAALIQAVDHTGGKGNSHYHSARDNAVSALGKILKAHTSTVNLAELVPFWVGHLPLKHDKAEARLMHGMLGEFAVQNAKDLVENQAFGGIVAKIVRIIAAVLETKQINSEFPPKAKAFLTALQAHGTADLPAIWSSLSDIEKAKINRLLGI